MNVGVVLLAGVIALVVAAGLIVVCVVTVGKEADRRVRRRGQ